jgi:hypothetical protein
MTKLLATHIEGSNLNGVAEALQLANQGASPPLHGMAIPIPRAMLDIANLLMKYLPDDPEETVSHRPDGQFYSLSHGQALKQTLEVTAFTAHRGPGQLV